MTLHDYLSKQERGALTQLANQIGTSKSYLSEIANGKAVPSAKLAKQLDRATGGQVPAWRTLGLEPPKAEAV